MRFPQIDPQQLHQAQQGQPAALDALLLALQPAVYNLARRMLGGKEDAQDASQEILLRITTHLAGFRGEALFSTWAFRIASNYLLTARTRAREVPVVSLESLPQKLDLGLRLAEANARPLEPADKLAAERIALACTQGMLMSLEREQRLAYVLDIAFGLDSETAAAVLEIAPAAYRKRLSRARQRLEAFMQDHCGLVNRQAACSCERQALALPAGGEDGRRAESELLALTRLADAAAVFRAHPDYRVPQRLIETVRAVLRQHTGSWQ
ncbi:RNA polymerase sigma factor [Pseudomonas citronellolis]|uniref:RNA polymerase sigma factor n=1 Tax=Pseudomonas citronellolis TaxID=53408 RepID=UPI00209CE669|nr:RNA polymerase sigma factor [Pseudomonas citronellolis]MCP1604187.1 RNA polymerase sigma factor (sigma-70 family) [Pseudomonas citronellolis]MCP1658262.1 RNA polymerase sigma factor (sigma-70 family) [Pseudomonas citronellolis]MCP1721725.1 RNA polymerase sigma factor (sigma-70 family) [Pseudomonas citronellolis]UUC52972.1 RNA polymerase sigma factor [Pseudomonas citronellolis]